jgi:hypothetical protein
MASFFHVISRISPPAAVACSKGLSRAFATFCEHALEEIGRQAVTKRLLDGLTIDFKAAARTCVARAA